MVDIPWTLNCNIVEDLMFFYSPLWIQWFIVHAHWTCKCNFLLSHFILIIYFNNSWKKISDLMTFKSLILHEAVYKACLPILHVSMYGTWLSDDVNKWCPSVAFCVCLFGVVSFFVLSCYKNPCIYKFIQKSMLLQ